MNSSTDILAAFILLASGLLLGELSGRLARASLERADRLPSTREMSGTIGSFFFWCGTAVGVIIAAAILARESVSQGYANAVDSLPYLMMGGLIMVVGYASSIGVSAAVGQSAMRATGVRHRNLERALRFLILFASAVIAISTQGFSTSLLIVGAVIVIGVPLTALSLLTVIGIADVAKNVSAGRALQSVLKEGHELTAGSVTGIIVNVGAVAVEVEQRDGTVTYLPTKQLLASSFSVNPVKSQRTADV